MVKYILLDIDGVLNKESDWKRSFTLNPDNIKVFGEKFEDQPVRIILISSWKEGFISKKNPSNAPYIRLLEKELAEYGLEISGVLTYRSRRETVCEFLKTHKDAICIDDEIKEYGIIPPNLKNQFIVPDYKYGLREKDFKKK